MSEKIFQPLYDRALIKKLVLKNTSAGGIILSSKEVESQDQGIVIAVGKGRPHSSGKTIPASVKVGEHVMFDRKGGVEITIEGKQLLVLADKDIIGVIE